MKDKRDYILIAIFQKFKHKCVNWRRNIILLSYTVACVYLYKSNFPFILANTCFQDYIENILKLTSLVESISSAES